jgi:hypothetical protein
MVGWHRDGYSADRQQARVLARLPEAPGTKLAGCRGRHGHVTREVGHREVKDHTRSAASEVRLVKKIAIDLLPSNYRHQLRENKYLPMSRPDRGLVAV